MEELFDVMILGAGAAGLSAWIYTSRARLRTIILNEGPAGGQMVLTNEVANYPGVEITNGFTIAILEAKANPRIDFIMGSEIREFVGNGKLREMIIEKLSTGERYRRKVDGVFIFIGYLPNTEFLKGMIELNYRNEIITDPEMKTNIEGVYAAGDCIVKKYRQITTAVADGTIAALSAAEYLRIRKNNEITV